jgi:hypothetical protein
MKFIFTPPPEDSEWYSEIERKIIEIDGSSALDNLMSYYFSKFDIVISPIDLQFDTQSINEANIESYEIGYSELDEKYKIGTVNSDTPAKQLFILAKLLFIRKMCTKLNKQNYKPRLLQKISEYINDVLDGKYILKSEIGRGAEFVEPAKK